MIRVSRYKIACMALPKAGCSTVKDLMAQIDPDTPIAGPHKTQRQEPRHGQRRIDALHTQYPTRRFRPHRWETVSDHWRFCVIRDPIERLLSVYTNRVVDLRDLHNCRKILRGRVQLPMDPDPDFFFLNLAAYAQAASVIRHHVLPAWLFLGPVLAAVPGTIPAYDRVYRTDELPLLARDLSERTGRTLRLRRANASQTKLTLHDLAPRTRDALRDATQQEYAYYGDHFRHVA